MLAAKLSPVPRKWTGKKRGSMLPQKVNCPMTSSPAMKTPMYAVERLLAMRKPKMRGIKNIPGNWTARRTDRHGASFR